MVYAGHVAGTVADQLDALVDALGSDRKAAAFVGVSHTQFGPWRGGSAPSARSLTRIGDGVAVVARLRAHGLTRGEIRSALQSLWPELDDRRPGTLIAAGETKAVLDAIDARHGGPPASTQLESPADLVAALRMLAFAAAASAEALAKAAP